MPVIEILSPRHEADLLQTKEIFLAYAKAINIDLCFQDFDTELANLPGDYSPPRGALLLAWVNPKFASCCATRPLDSSDYANAAEMKRLFVRPEFRGLGLGRQLAESIIDAARMSGYDSVLLDTLDDMEIARAMYEDLGFKEIPPYYHNPLAGAHYLKVDL